MWFCAVTPLIQHKQTSKFTRIKMFRSCFKEVDYVLESHIRLRASDVALICRWSCGPFCCSLFGRLWNSHMTSESCPNNNIPPGAVTGTYCSLSAAPHHRLTGPPPSPQLKPGMAGPPWAEGPAWPEHNGGSTGPTCQHSRGLTDISIHGRTDLLACSLDLSFSYLYLPTACSLLCHPFFSASPSLLALISRASVHTCYPTLSNSGRRTLKRLRAQASNALCGSAQRRSSSSSSSSSSSQFGFNSSIDFCADKHPN